MQTSSHPIKIIQKPKGKLPKKSSGDTLPLLLLLTLLGCSTHSPLPARESCLEGTHRVENECITNAETAGESDAPEGTAPDGTRPETPADPASPETLLSLSITSPVSHTSYEEDEALTFSGTLNGLTNHPDYEELTLTWSSDLDGELHTEVVEQDGPTRFTAAPLRPGVHTITLTARSGDDEAASASLYVGICGWVLIEDFESDLSEDQWLVYNDAYRDPRGWLELTGNTQSKKGHIFNIGQSISPGNTRLQFDIATGQCDIPGTCYPTSCAADGFAASVYNVNSTEGLDEIISTAQHGGGLGFHQATPPEVESFHIEFDTWHNEFDPTISDHVAIHLNSDSHTPYFYNDAPDLEDNRWHRVLLDIRGSRITVDLDGTTLISGDIPEYSFKGGLIGFSGTTGWCTNYHRIDNLKRQPQCTFE